MRSHILLVAAGNGSANAEIARAVAQTGHRFCHVETSREAFELLNAPTSNIDAVVIDLDHGIHGISVPEALGCCKSVPSVIVATGLEPSEMAPVIRRHGASACLSKPFRSVELSSIIKRLCLEKPRSNSCDLWGHERCEPQDARLGGLESCC